MIYDNLDIFTPSYMYDGKANDHSFVFDGKQWHLFHIGLGRDGNNTIEHAISPDLMSWTAQGEVLPKGPGPSWESHPRACAPYAYSWEGEPYLFYSRYSGSEHEGFHRMYNDHYQQIGVGVGADWFSLEKYNGNPVFHPDSSWCPWGDKESIQFRPHTCRDPHVVRHGDEFLLYYVSSTRRQNYSAVGHAVSKDLLHWKDLGAVIERPIVWCRTACCESPCVVKHGNLWWLFYTHQGMTWYCVSNTPHKFENPTALNPVHAGEIFQAGDRWLMSHIDCLSGVFSLAEIDLSVNPPVFRQWNGNDKCEVH